MRCPFCGELLTVHILATPKAPARHYCRICKKELHLARGPVCGACGYSYDSFKRKGLLGCEHCYSAFAPRLEPLMLDYQGHLPGLRPYLETPAWTSLARSRTQEFLELLSKSTFSSANKADQKENVFQAPHLPFWKEPFGVGTKKDIIKENKETHTENKSNIKKHFSGQKLSIRLRIARNIAGVPFFHRLDEARQRTLRHLIESPASPIPLELKNTKKKEQLSFVKHIELLTGEEDHFRIAAYFESGLEEFLSQDGQKENTDKATGLLCELQGLALLYETAWQPDYGYLTACPAISGEGIRLSLQLFLPHLSAHRADWLCRLKESGFEVRSPGIEHYNYTPELQISLRSWPYGSDAARQIQKLFGFVRQCLRWEKGL